jgi:hypothetical protein
MENSHIRIDKPGKSREELLTCLEKFEKNYSKEIKEYDLRILEIDSGYNIKVEKSVLFMNFYLDAKIIAHDGYFDINYDTNVPQGKLKEVLNKVEEVLEEC